VAVVILRVNEYEIGAKYEICLVRSHEFGRNVAVASCLMYNSVFGCAELIYKIVQFFVVLLLFLS